MYTEGSADFVIDQGLYYPAATNYGYICTGFDSPGDWDDHHRIFGLDGQDIQYAGVQTENLPYVYYTPSFGYAQSPFNPYNPYIPGAVMGVDGPFVGSQQYYAIPSYENPVSLPPYFPMIVQSSADIIANSTTDPLTDTAASTNNRADGPRLKNNLSSASSPFTPTPLGTAPGQINSFSLLSNGMKGSAGSSKHSVTQGTITSDTFPSAPSQHIQGKVAQGIENVSHKKVLSNRGQIRVTLPSDNGLSNFGSSDHARATVDKVQPKFMYGRSLTDLKASPDALAEQNRGPRTNRSKNQLVVKAYTMRAGEVDDHGNIVIHTDQYNKDDFHVDYVNAKFFVIKSYSEDDVHKSIKYNVWSSTPNGNKKLNSAYEEAQRIGAGAPGGCPIFLFFSVNASGQFCGVAEMIGPVDFHKDMDFWQQDKWSGSFPVKWHIIKDVPNPNFRHIILENNENKPVTNSRDTQEIHYKKGMEMLKIFKNHASKTSLLDDFIYYESRQKILQEEKTKLLIRNYETPFVVPVLDPPRKLNSLLDTSSPEVKRISKPTDLRSENDVAAPSEQVSFDAGNKSTASREPVAVEEPNIGNALKIGSLSISAKHSDTEASPATIANSMSKAQSVDVVTVGSMPVKVNGLGESSGFLTVGTIPLDPRALKRNQAASSKDVPQIA